jgi:succinyl-CoA synthetase beta subunit
MIAGITGAPWLEGFRGSPRGDIAALASVVRTMSRMAVVLEGTLAELEINPLIVLPEGRGVKAVDVLATLAQGSLIE